MAEIEADRLRAATRIQKLWGGIVLLKGAGTVITDGSNTPFVVAGGNPGMATGGMGDVLSGMIGAFLGQLEDFTRATVAAASAHLAAADLASERVGYKSLVPADVLDALPSVLKQTETMPFHDDREAR